jgi:hypothetical protein
MMWQVGTREFITQRRKDAKCSIHLSLVSIASLRLCVIRSFSLLVAPMNCGIEIWNSLCGAEN